MGLTPAGVCTPRRRQCRRHSSPLSSALIALSLCAVATQGQLLFPSEHLEQDLFTSRQSEGLVDAAAGSLWAESETTPRIAIIGAGAGGSSAAYFLSHFRKLQGEGLLSDVTVFEKEHHIGGRSTVVYPWNDDPYATPDSLDGDAMMDDPVELGASIFVDANKNMMTAARTFGLSLVENIGESGGMGIWDGEHFVWQESGASGWGYWDLAKMFWRYGRAPLKVNTLVKKTVAAFTSLYGTDFAALGPFNSLRAFAAATELTQPASQTAAAFFASEGIDPLFTSELIAAGTQVNYGTPASQIHGLGALVSLAAQGAHAVKGGNRKIFENFVASSNSRLRLGGGAKVTQIVKLDASNATRAKWVVHTPDGGGTFDAVILAAPFHQTGIKLVNTHAASLIPPQAYVKLHVTFVITNASTPSPSFFAAPKVPTAVFSTMDTPSSSKPPFNSLNYLQPLSAAAGAQFGPDSTWHVVKIFSHDALDLDTNSVLADLFGGRANVAKAWSRVWQAYPQLDPVVVEDELAPIRPDEGLYYVNSMERLISTMETETVSAFNVVNLLLKDFYGYQAPKSWAEWDD